MANRTKHMERSRRSYHTAKPFADFARKANVKAGAKESKGFFDGVKKLFHRTTSK